MKKPSLQIAIISLFIISSCISSKGTKVNDYYTRHSQQNGDLLFIYEYEDFRMLNNKSELFFDVTLQESQDSVTVNYTFFSKEAKNTNTFRFESEKVKIHSPAEQLFIDFDNKRWKYRYSTKISYSDFKKLITSPDQPKIGVVLADNNVLTYITKVRPWQKYTDAVEKILYLFEEN